MCVCFAVIVVIVFVQWNSELAFYFRPLLVVYALTHTHTPAPSLWFHLLHLRIKLMQILSSRCCCYVVVQKLKKKTFFCNLEQIFQAVLLLF